MKTKSKQWIEAAKILSRDITAQIKCPECNEGVLVVKDEEIKEWNKVDRYLLCSKCGKWNVITMDKPITDEVD